MKITHASLFSGIGGFDLAAEQCGFENIFHCENNPFLTPILNYYWPNAISYDDITTTDFTIHRGTIDILTGGFPCQPYSHAGKRKGKDDERHLWPQMLRAIREIQPIYVVGENVPGIVSWSAGLVFHEVQTELEDEGYEVQPFILPACGVGAPHRRDRVFFVAYSVSAHASSIRCKGGNIEPKSNNQREQQICKNFKYNWNEIRSEIEGCGTIATNTNGSGRKKQYATTEPIKQKFNCGNYDARNVTNTKSKQSKPGQFKQRNVSQSKQREFGGINCKNGGRLTPYARLFRPKERQQFAMGTIKLCEKRNVTYANGGRFSRQEYGQTQSGRIAETRILDNWRNFPTQSPVCSRNDGVSFKLDGITLPKWTNESIKGYGNAVVPQLIIPIFNTIISHLKNQVK